MTVTAVPLPFDHPEVLTLAPADAAPTHAPVRDPEGAVEELQTHLQTVPVTW